MFSALLFLDLISPDVVLSTSQNTMLVVMIVFAASKFHHCEIFLHHHYHQIQPLILPALWTTPSCMCHLVPHLGRYIGAIPHGKWSFDMIH